MNLITRQSCTHPASPSWAIGVNSLSRISKKTTLKRILLGLSTFFIVVFLIFWQIVFIATQFEWQIGTLKTGSMEPSLQVGELLAVKPMDPNTIKQGDVIAFRHQSHLDETITHRVTEVIAGADTPLFRTKGDANSSADDTLVSPKNFEGKVVFHIPYVGYFANFAQTPIGFGLMLVTPALFLAVIEIGKIRKMLRGFAKV